MPVVFKSVFIVLSAVVIKSHSLHQNSSYETPDIMKEAIIKEMKASDPDAAITKNRQISNTLGVGGPVAAGLAFVGLNLAFISLLVPFVITAVTVGERRNYQSEDDYNSLPSQLDKLRNLYGWDTQDTDYSERSSSNENRDVVDKIARFGQKLLSYIKHPNRNV
ncbi:hypothetical protein AVEN_194614-1 [Araneus ventricosus]|uniref:Uncharacterized protein n=1 Tax=Araneus ventricosus TaxID=182803 RepID=A0A4Y2A6X2_ARAVE|nr:hypothetical protein AVEN_194614-1 [Araneus ventricosus]